ncbi:tRNA (cytidine(34)-2'-O)-methyltransferase [Dermabacteraceae bacterium P7006]
MFNVMFYEPRIAGNTGNAIRLSAVTGANLHLVEPLCFDFEDAKLRRAGLDYHDLAVVTVHKNFMQALAALPEQRVFAFTTQATRCFSDISYQEGDILLFGPEPTGLPPEALAHERITEQVKIPMIPGRRSLNLANSASIALYEAWRQHGYAGGR